MPRLRYPPERICLSRYIHGGVHDTGPAETGPVGGAAPGTGSGAGDLQDLPGVDDVGRLQDVAVGVEDRLERAGVAVDVAGDLGERVAALDGVLPVQVVVGDLDVGDHVVLPPAVTLDRVPQLVLRQL